MPIYEYRCTKCDDETEVMQRITEGPLRKCRKCAGRLEKLISRTSCQRKGGGWYDSGYTKASGGGNSKGKSKSSSGGKSTSDKSKKGSSSTKDGESKSA